VDGAEGLTNADAKQYHRALAKNTKHTIAVSAVDSDDEQGDAELKKFPPDGVKYGLSFASMDEAISMQ
jgi:predicted dehydrogenase